MVWVSVGLLDLGQTSRFRRGERRRKVRREAKATARSRSSHHGHDQIHDAVKWGRLLPTGRRNSSRIDPANYKSISSGFGVLLKEQGARGFFRGLVPSLVTVIRGLASLGSTSSLRRPTQIWLGQTMP
ncbi:hypothetical protein ACQJBY_035188 [Aegilops geniculata]